MRPGQSKPVTIAAFAAIVGMAALAPMTAVWCAVPAQVIGLRQKCPSLGGFFNVFLSKDCVRVEGRSLIVFAQGPAWTTTVINKRKKIYWRSDYKETLKRIESFRTLSSAMDESGAYQWRRGDSQTFGGYPMEQWRSDGSGKKKGGNPAECWTISGSLFDPHCAEIVSTCYGIPSTGHGVPVKFFCKGTENSLLPMPTRTRDDEEQQVQEMLWLNTAAIKKIPTPQGLFDIPKGFKQTKIYSDIATEGDAHSDDTQFIIKDLQKDPKALFNSR